MAKPTRLKASNDIARTNEDAALKINVVANDDLAGGTITSYSSVSQYGAKITLNADGTLSYDPTTSALQALPSGVSYNDSFTYTITSGGQTSTATVNVKVDGRADRPLFAEDTNTFVSAVAEGAATGTQVVTAKATDADWGSTISYSLVGDADGRFAINPTTGVVTIADGSRLDYENAQSHTITVRASDGALSSDSAFTINVTNVAPTWAATPDKDGAADTVAENATVDTYVGIKLDSNSAVDVNSGAITYSLVGDTSEGGFKIGSDGRVLVADSSKLDYEAAQSHTITVRASDGNKSTDQSFTINVGNVDEVSTSRALYLEAYTNTDGENPTTDIIKINSDGTREVIEIDGTGDFSSLTAVGDELYFVQHATWTRSDEKIYKVGSDGEPVLVAQVELGERWERSGNGSALTAFNGEVYFSGVTDTGVVDEDGYPVPEVDLFKITADGTVEALEINPTGSSAPQDLFVFNDALYLEAYTNTDGENPTTDIIKINSDGTREVIEIDGTGDFSSLTAVGDELYFVQHATWTRSDEKIYKVGSDGEPVLVAQVELGERWERSGNGSALTAFNGEVYFSGVTDTGVVDEDGYPVPEVDLFKITADGTVEALEINPTGSSAPQDLFVFNDALYLEAYTNTDGENPTTDIIKINSDGTREVIEIDGTGDFSSLTAVGDELYFVQHATWTRSDEKIYKVGSDGEPVLVAQVELGERWERSGNGSALTAFNGEVYFSGVTDTGVVDEDGYPVPEVDLFKITADGTVEALEINPTGSSAPQDLFVL